MKKQNVLSKGSAAVFIKGQEKVVKNMGWILNHRGEIKSITVEKLIDCPENTKYDKGAWEAVFSATLEDGREFRCLYASWQVAQETVAKYFKGHTVTINN